MGNTDMMSCGGEIVRDEERICNIRESTVVNECLGAQFSGSFFLSFT